MAKAVEEPVGAMTKLQYKQIGQDEDGEFTILYRPKVSYCTLYCCARVRRISINIVKLQSSLSAQIKPSLRVSCIRFENCVSSIMMIIITLKKN